MKTFLRQNIPRWNVRTSQVPPVKSPHGECPHCEKLHGEMSFFIWTWHKNDKLDYLASWNKLSFYFLWVPVGFSAKCVGFLLFELMWQSYCSFEKCESMRLSLVYSNLQYMNCKETVGVNWQYISQFVEKL